MTPFSPAKLKAFRAALLTWFDKNGKSYPWRETTDPWAILVSEMMLQQTTVASVIANRRFEKFLTEFPDLSTIAEASEEKILRAWEGLGYYNRVRNLQKTAQAVLQDHGGQFPKDATSLLTLPGIGRYTAGAVSSFAFNEPAPIVDGNIARVLARVFDYREAIDSTTGQKQLWTWAEQLLDIESPRLFNSAIMELGQTECSPRSPACLTCPVQTFCQAQNPAELPVKKPRKKFVAIDEHAVFILKNDHLLLAEGTGTRRKGFWHLPLRTAKEIAHCEAAFTSKYTITHHKVTVSLYLLEEDQLPNSLSEGEHFHPVNTLEDLPIPSPIRRIIQKALT